MSEYWVSHKRYHCKYCNIYIADDKPSRQQHENGLRHKGNVERFVRGLYKEGEKRVREREEEKGIMASVGRAAEVAYALDVASGRGGTSSSGGVTRQTRDSTAAPKLKAKTMTMKPSDPYANYSTAASLGYGDPDTEEVQQSTPGAWTVVEKSREMEEEGRGEKRGAEEVGEEDVRAFKLRKKTVAVGLGEIYDPGKLDESNQAGSIDEPNLFRKRKGRRPRITFFSTAMAHTSPSESLDDSRLSFVPSPPQFKYRLYKRRFAGLLGFVILGFVTGMPWAWFGPISTEAATQFEISVDQVNWLGNILSCIFIPISLFVPIFCSRFGISRCAQIGALMTLISGWIRYAGTSTSLSSQSAYTLLFLGQVISHPLHSALFPLIFFIPKTFSAIAQPIFQVLGPMYSEKWFDLKGRTTATMIIAIGPSFPFPPPYPSYSLVYTANPVGGAIAQLLSPLVGTPRQSVLVLAIISTAATPAVLFITNAPPIPPTYAGSKPPQTLSSLCRAILGWSVSPDAYMTFHERFDFVIVTLLFGVFVGATNALSVLSAEWFQPMGYSDTIAGLMGASLLLSGIVASIVTAPLLDRIFTHKLGITLKILVPIVAVGWFSLIWAVRPNNTAALFTIFIVIGICSLMMLPIGLELGVELTRNADASAALLWCSGNLFGIILILGEGALRASSTANPPYNMDNALILHGTVVVVFGSVVFFIRARQARRELDETMAAESAIPMVSSPNVAGKLEETTEELKTIQDPS
ncbi:major facilitator superfamily domain-containing protein [Lanmaoa asiatica]|nr:major facilitator superfamily domain-containing protein [Lanmaoa asiatica]